ncbi:hypothetical protein Syun_004327 [Stephania yunnanensis]|uniref:Plastocyanin-like domain-containing protein n=1 Tax=Stephania yunnanensis TaxID=152371 RepID=A0AAP0L5C5_9MAGN
MFQSEFLTLRNFKGRLPTSTINATARQTYCPICSLAHPLMPTGSIPNPLFVFLHKLVFRSALPINIFCFSHNYLNDLPSLDPESYRYLIFLKVVLKNISRLCGTKPIVTVNKQFLGPTLYAREGDRVLVKVVNHVKYNLSIHWSNIICRVTFHRISKPREITKTKKIWMRSKFGGMPREGWNYE